MINHVRMIPQFLAAALVVIITALVSGCPEQPEEAEITTRPRTESQHPGYGDQVYICTIPPLGMIIEELVKGRSGVVTLVHPGVSVKDFVPSPTDTVSINNCDMLFYVDDSLESWIGSLEPPEMTAVFDLVPADARLTLEPVLGRAAIIYDMENSHVLDYHFWLDPFVIKEILPALVNRLSAVDPNGTIAYKANMVAFSARLDEIHSETKMLLEGFEEEKFLLGHPSFQYFCSRYGLKPTGVLLAEPHEVPEPRIQDRIITAYRSLEPEVVFTEPQLDQDVVEYMAAGLGVPVYELDPLGGPNDRRTYADLLFYNANSFVIAFGE